MFCPECESEYRQGIERCSDCDVPLVWELKEQSHVAANLLPLVEAVSFDLVGDLLDRFEKAGVPYVVEAGTALSLLNNDQMSLDEPEPWEARISVARSFADRARRILQEIEGQYGRDAVKRY